MKKTIGIAANRNLKPASTSGEVSPTPTLIAMKLRPQTIATESAARMSRAVMTRTGAPPGRDGGLGVIRSARASASVSYQAKPGTAIGGWDYPHRGSAAFRLRAQAEIMS